MPRPQRRSGARASERQITGRDHHLALRIPGIAGMAGLPALIRTRSIHEKPLKPPSANGRAPVRGH